MEHPEAPRRSTEFESVAPSMQQTIRGLVELLGALQAATDPEVARLISLDINHILTTHPELAPLVYPNN